MHKELLVDKFLDIIECIDIVEARFIEIKNPEDFVGMRNVISHAYMEIDHNVIYKTCKTHLPVLKETIKSIVSRLNESKD